MTDADWTRLPHDPQGFFELEDSFDRKSLKRAYSKRIRQYKPEKFPEEFQKIRIAYELLDGQLRYGQVQSNIQRTAEYQWQVASSDSVTNGSADTEAIPATPFHERLRKESPAEIYRDLSPRKNKTPFDFFALALTSDVVTKDQTMFFQWLLKGIEQHPADQGLFSLLYEYMQTDLSAELLPKFLLAISKIVKSDRYYFLTESAWRQLLRNVEFGKFKQVLAKCESNLKDFRVEGKIAFYVQILQQAMWKGDQDWLQEKSEFIETNFANVPSQLEMDLHLLDCMREYVSQFSEVVGKNAIRQKVHNALVDFFMEDAQTGDQRVIECQLELADDGQALLKAFPAEKGREDGSASPATSMWMLWQIVSHDVVDRNGLNPKQISHKKFISRLYHMMNDLEGSWSFGRRRLIVYYLCSWLPYPLFGALPFLVLWSWLDSSTVLYTAIFLMAVSLVLCHLILVPKTFEPIQIKLMESSIFGDYRKTWRSRFIQLLDATQASMGELTRSTLEIVWEREHDLQATTFLAQFVPQDLGLAFYSEATRYRN